MLTCLTNFLYDAPTADSCRNDEHALIIDAIAKRDQARAEKLMLDHLDHIESSLKLDNTNGDADLEAIFKD
jgi:DNA-binding GntR family transcriptional regulator